MIFLLITLLILSILSIFGLSWAIYQLWWQHFRESTMAFSGRVNSGYEVINTETVISQQWKSSSQLEKYIEQSQWAFFISKRLSQSSLHINTMQFLIFSASIWVLLTSLFLYLHLNGLISLLGAFLIASIPYDWISYQYKKRQILLERQLPDILDFIARSMQAGHDFNSALRLAALESPLPIGKEFQAVFDEINFGGTLHHAMEGLSKKIDCPDIKYFAIAVLINREIGGDISLLLKNVASLIRDRMNFKDTVYAMTAEGRVSAMILGAIPFLIGTLIYFVSPGFMDVLWIDPLGQKLFLYALLLMIFGGLWMYRMVQIKV